MTRDTQVDICTGVWVVMHTEMRMDVCMDVCVDMCMDVCMDMYLDICTRICPLLSSFAHRHVSGQLSRHVLRSM